MLRKLKDPVSGLTHLLGALLSVAGLTVLVYVGAVRGTAWHVVSFAIFGASLILLYSASALYHLLPLAPRGSQALRRLDHMMIYVLIAGTYTPICLVPLRGGWGWSLLGIIWGAAVAGMGLKMAWLHAPRWLSTAFYVGMGWAAVIAVVPLVRAMPAGGLAWMLAGGLFYTVGAVIYGTRWPNPVTGVFGFHEIWHLFVLAGSFSHFWLMLRYVAYLA